MSSEDKMLRITLVRSPIGRPAVQRRTVRALGLKRMNHSVVQKSTPEIKGMISRVSHLLTVEPCVEEEV